MITKRRNFVFRFLSGLFLSGLLLLSGCSQDDVSNVPAGSRAIGFRAQGGMSTLKATTAAAADIHSFVVNAHYGDTWGSMDNFLLPAVTVYRGEDNIWTYSPKAYYPTEDEGAVEFFAYSPANSKHVTTSKLGLATTATQTISYKVEAPVGSTTVQEDLLVAYEKVASTSYTSPTFDGTVSLTFRHALSRVLVAAGSKLEEPVTIKSLKLKNLYSAGTLSLAGNTATGAGNKSNGIPAASAAWVYTAGDYVTLWDYTDTQTKEYPYLLPESGVSVGEYVESPLKLPLVTGRDQGMFILPQTTANLDTSNEFGLEVEYSVGSGSPKTSTIRFGDLDNQVGKGVTFEIGREYVLNLVFSSGGSGGQGGDDGGGITIGASVSFSTIADDYNGPVYVDAGTPDGLPVWAQSNIYFVEEDATTDPECVVGHLAFADENDDSKKLYQGVFFKWGSLIGVDPTGSFGNDTYLFIPDFVSGKYIKVKVSNVASKASAYYGVVGATTYASIPCVDDEFGPYGARTNDDLRDYSNTASYQTYKGDVCRFLSNGNGVSGSWRLPKSEDFGDSDSEYDRTGMTGATTVTTTDVNGASTVPYRVTSHVISHNGKEVTFPASGYRDANGSLGSAGGAGDYWSSSVFNATLTYYLYFISSLVNPGFNSGRANGMSGRCVRE
ncbi:MAG: fimbrillin family protein [Prevotella sp.]|jgi:hypothetical protein|nr:fimbrillin family protein [Prevotella sp.]